MIRLARGLWPMVIAVLVAAGCRNLDFTGEECLLSVFPVSQEVSVGQTGRSVVRNPCTRVSGTPYVWTSLNPEFVEVQRETDSTAVLTGVAVGSAAVKVTATSVRSAETGVYTGTTFVTVK